MTPPVEEAYDVSLAELLPEVLLSSIGEQLAAGEDVLRPQHLACRKVIKAAEGALHKLKVDNTAARALLGKCGTTVERLMEERPTNLMWYNKVWWRRTRRLTNVLKSEALAQLQMPTRTTISAQRAPLPSGAAAGGGMPRLELSLNFNQIGDAGKQALAPPLPVGPSASWSGSASATTVGDAGLAALAAALERRAAGAQGAEPPHEEE